MQNYWVHDKSIVRAYRSLASTIILVACEDYRKALWTLKRYPENDYAKGQAFSCERFFLGDWFQCLTEADGAYIVCKMKEMVMNENYKGEKIECYRTKNVTQK